MSGDVQTMREKAIDEYHESLATDVNLTAEFFARLKERMTARRLLYGGRALGVSLRPHFLSRVQYDALAAASETLGAAFERVAAAVLAEPARIESLGLTERERRLALVDPGYSHPAVTTRLDAFVHRDRIKFVEYNAENPSSLTDQAGLNQVLFEVPAMQRMAERYRLRQFTLTGEMLAALTEAFHEWGGTGAPNVAILDWANLPTADEFVLLRNFFAGQGVPTVICTPEELEYDRGRLRCGNFPIDVVYKRVIIHEFLTRCDDSHPLVQAYLNGDVCLVNSFRCKLLHKKAAFALLTDADNEKWFTPAQREVIRRTVPWTRRVAEKKTSYQGSVIDLVEHVRRNRASFVLKPNDDYGGRSVVIGERAEASEWEAALASALAGDYVVQEKIELHTEVFPIFDDHAWSLQPMYLDTNPFLFHGRVAGALVRLSDSPIVNVTSGGGETGFFVIEGEAVSV